MEEIPLKATCKFSFPKQVIEKLLMVIGYSFIFRRFLDCKLEKPDTNF